MCTFGVLGLSCETPAASGPLGLHTKTRELQTYTLEGPGASNTTKKPREDPQRERKRTKMRAGEGKKSAKFWVSHPSGPRPSEPHFGEPQFRAPHFEAPPFGLGAHPWAPHPSEPHPSAAPFGAPRPCFFCPVCVFLSRMHLFILSRQRFVYFVPFPFFFVPWRFFCPNTLDEVDFTLQRASRTGGSAGGLSIVNVCPSWSASCRRCLMSQMKRLMCMLCGLQGSVVCPLVFCPDKQENKDGREPRRVRGRGGAELRHTTECMRAQNFDDFSSMSPLILSSPQLSNISTRSSVVAMTRNKWWQLCGVGSVTACRR